MKLLISLLIVAFSFSKLYAQPQAGTFAPDFTVFDIDGNQHTLSDYTNSGKSVFLVFFAAWCEPNWSYHNMGTVQEFYNTYGPDGENTSMVFFVEGELGNTMNQIYGSSLEGETQGNWTLNTPYPIIDDLGDLMVGYNISYFPTVVPICPGGIIQSGELISPPVEMLVASSESCVLAETNVNPAITLVSSPSIFGCSDVNSLEITITNYGFQVLEECEITVSGSVEEMIYNWTGSLSTYQSETFTVDGLELTGEGPAVVTITSPDDYTGDNEGIFQFDLPTIGSSHFHLQLMTDGWPEESSWVLRKDGVDILASEPYAIVDNLYEQDFYVSELGCYEFTFYDSWGDGINGEQWGQENGFLKLFTIDELGNIVEYAIDYNGSYEFMELLATINVTEFVPVTISGIVFDDQDEDGYYDDTENGIGNVEVHLGDYITYTNENGAYSFTDVEDAENLSILYDALVWPSATTETDVDISAAADATFNFGLSANDPNFGVGFVYTDPWMYFCQMESSMYLTVTNESNQPLDEVVVVMNVDPLLTVVSSTPEGEITGNTITWDIEDLGTGENFFISVLVMVPSFEFMGSDIINSVSVEGFENNVSVDFDSASYPDVLECSYDPNDKQVFPAGVNDQHFIMNGTDLEYLVRFQNTGTAPAFNVNVQDILDNDLQYETFELLATSHQCQPTINLETGEVNFYFADIMLPDSLSDEPGSHGFIRYKISPYPSLAEMTTIENTANIFFDFNPAVVTNTTLNTISDLYFGINEFENAFINVFPNPANDQIIIRNSGNTQINELTIMDALGKTIYSENMILVPGATMTVDVSELQAGYYLLRIHSNDNVVSGSLVIQHH